MGGQAEIKNEQEQYEKEAYGAPRRNIAAIENLAGRTKKMEEQLQSGFDPVALANLRFGEPMRQNVKAKLQGGGEPVRNERGDTIGAVYTNRFGFKEYTGQSEYNPLAAQVQRATQTGDAYKDVVRGDGGYITRTQPTTAVRTASGVLRTGTGVVQRAVTPTAQAGQEPTPTTTVPVTSAQTASQIVSPSAAARRRSLLGSGGAGGAASRFFLGQ